MSNLSKHLKKIGLLIVLTLLLVGWQIMQPINQFVESIPLLTENCGEQASYPMTLSDFVPDCWLTK
ncbi:MAG: hypothetical protein AAF490_29720 [Chloroflexota bacterium]